MNYFDEYSWTVLSTLTELSTITSISKTVITTKENSSCISGHSSFPAAPTNIPNLI